MQTQKIQILDIIKISINAGKTILDVYHADGVEVEYKSDNSPLTLADKKSNAMITHQLNALYPDIPILSEEGKHLPYSERKSWDYLWVVDPLDGTKEFVKRNGEFTVNIALVHKGNPILGVIYAPVLDTLFFAQTGLGSFKLQQCSEQMTLDEAELITQAEKLPLAVQREQISAVASRSHLSPETEDYLNKVKEKFGEIDITSAGSSLKLCLVAEGLADVYPRFAPTMEWDTAAGQAIVEQAGGKVVQVDTGLPLRYNKEDLLNPWFIVKSSDFDDQQ